MARNTTPARTATVAKAAKKTTAPVAPAAVQGSTDLDWSDLSEPEPIVYDRVLGAKDYEAITPAPIKARVRSAYEATVAKGLTGDGRARPVKFSLTCATPAHAEAFVQAGKLYAKFCGWTMRGGVVDETEFATLVGRGIVSPDAFPGAVVSYSVKDSEARPKS